MKLDMFILIANFLIFTACLSSAIYELFIAKELLSFIDIFLRVVILSFSFFFMQVVIKYTVKDYLNE